MHGRALGDEARTTLRARSIDVGIALIAILAAIVWTAVSGKDLNWDQLHYHLYLPFSQLHDRLGTDFMPANVQSYLNPLPYFPFYWMVINEWPSMLVASVLAALHAANIVLAYFIARSVIQAEEVHRAAYAALGALLAFLSPVFLMEVGTSFADVTTSVPVLAGLLLALRIKAASRWYVDAALFAGVCTGLAAGMKITNMIYAPAMAMLVLCMPLTGRRRLQAVTLLGCGGLLGLLLSHGYWSWALWTEFGNPLFPFLNTIFNSADYPSVSLEHERFRPSSFLEAITLPLRIMGLRSWVYLETAAPDLRFAALIVSGCVWLGIKLKQLPHARTFAPLWGASLALPFFAFVGSALVLWIGSSANGRYGIVLSILCGPALAIAVHALMPQCSRRSIKIAAVLTALLTLQGLHLANVKLRWSQEPWTDTWYQVSVPGKLQSTPYLYVSLGPTANTYIAPYVDPDSAFINHAGQVSFDPEGPGGDRLKELFARFEGRTRMLTSAPVATLSEPERLTRWQGSSDLVLRRLGFATDRSDCVFLISAGTSRIAGNDHDQADEKARVLLSCALRRIAIPNSEIEERRLATALFERVVKACPELLDPEYTVLEQGPGGWFASYITTDSILRLEDGKLFVIQPRASHPLYLGTTSQWERSVTPRVCTEVVGRLRDVLNFDQPDPT